MFVGLLIIFRFTLIQSERIFLPKSLLTNQSLSTFSSSSIYLCYLHQLNNSKEIFLENYQIIHNDDDDKNLSYVHHLLVYECSTNEKLNYAGLCGMYNLQSMPQLVYQSCQTRILIAWAKGSQLTYNYPENTGLKFRPYTQLLLEVHFEPFPSPSSSHSIGIDLKFYSQIQTPRYEIGVLTLGTLAKSPLYLPPRLDSIDFPTYCFRDCLKFFFKNLSEIHIFSILVHAHRHAKRIHLYDRDYRTIIDRNPFEYHRQEMFFFSKPYPKLQSSNELSLICSYSTANDFNQPILGGYHSNNEMCQAFLYYYPKIPFFPLCLSLPLYSNKTHLDSLKQNWTLKQSLDLQNQFDSNHHHLSMCGDNFFSNQTILQMKIYQHSNKSPQLDQWFSIQFYSSSSFYFLFLCISFLCCYLIIKKSLHCFSNHNALLNSIY